MKLKNTSWVILALLVLPIVITLTQCIGPVKSADPRGEAYAGQQTCKSCHADVYKSHISTWHNNSSQPAGSHNIHQNLKAGKNYFQLNDSTRITIEKRNGKFYQVAYQNNKELQKKPLDIVFGGDKAETYLYWENKRLFELPLSYFNNLQSWTNSPGYPGTSANFIRPIIKRCFECHSSYISEATSTEQSLSQKLEFEKSTLINGIDCERCHGPGAKHVEFHNEHPEDKSAGFIASFKSLNRGQKLDACAVCHSGNKEVYLTTTFNFKIGDTLANLKEPGFIKKSNNAARLDVHGNQYGLLAASKCFIMSKMDCTTCHDAHSNKPSTLKSYTTICISCHNAPEKLHSVSAMQTKGALLSKCIDCHMPAQPSEAINIRSANGKRMVPYMVRTHAIAIYHSDKTK